MPVKLILVLLSFLCLNINGQIYPWKDYPELFHDVQLSGIFSNSKIFADCSPLLKPSEMDSTYRVEKKQPSFNLQDFISTYFVVDTSKYHPTAEGAMQSSKEIVGDRFEDLKKKPERRNNTLIDLKYPFIVSDPNAKDILYRDSYFMMLGLEANGNIDYVESMVRNFALLIDQYGYIPYGNRTYYLGQTGMPYFALMLQILERDGRHDVVLDFLPQLEMEYMFWMEGKDSLNKRNTSYKRVVLMPNGSVLNRHWNQINSPRPQDYSLDYTVFNEYFENDSSFYDKVWTLQEAQWISTPLSKNTLIGIDTIPVLSIVPVGLNSLLYSMETKLANLYMRLGNKKMAEFYQDLAEDRNKSMHKYLWNKDIDFYTSYDLVTGTNLKSDLQGVYPLYLGMVKKRDAERSAKFIEKNFLGDSGVISKSIFCPSISLCSPELQYLSYQALMEYGFHSLAKTIRSRWIEENGYTENSDNIKNIEQKKTADHPIGIDYAVYLALSKKGKN